MFEFGLKIKTAVLRVLVLACVGFGMAALGLVSRYRRPIWAPIVVVLVLLLSACSAVEADELHEFQILVPASTYSYFPSPEGPGLPGCEPNDFQCDFEVSGTLLLEIDTDGQTARFAAADLTTIGNDSVFGPGEFNISDTSSPLRTSQFTLISVISGTSTFRDTRFRDSGVNPYTMQIVVDEFTLALSGGLDFTPVDGDGFDFSISAIRIPEPASYVLAAVGIICALIICRQLQSKLTV